MSKLIALPPNPHRVRKQACAWLARIDAGLTESDRNGLQAWLAKSPAHPCALLEISKLWNDMEILGELEALFPLRQQVHRTQGAYFGRRVVVMTAIGTLLGVALFLGLGNPWRIPMRLSGEQAVRALAAPRPHPQVYVTAVGDQSSVRLEDGSSLTLNTDTRAMVVYSETERRVVLERGEANFAVVADPARPFIVEAGDRVIQAIGTAFNVQLRRDRDVEVTVTEGQVRVRPAPGVLQTASVPAKLDRDAIEAVVSAGESVRVVHEIDAIRADLQKLDPEAIEIELAWQQGMLIFKGERLDEALWEVGRYTTVEFELADPALNEVRVGGYFQAGDIEGLLHALRESFGINAWREGDRVVLSSG